MNALDRRPSQAPGHRGTGFPPRSTSDISLPPRAGRRWLRWLACLGGLLAAAVSSQAGDYTSAKAGDPSRTGGYAYALDNHGRVATTSLARSFLFLDRGYSSFVEITNLNVATTTPGMVAQGMNDRGDVAGRYRTNGAPANQTRGFVRRADGTFETFDYPGVSSTSISDINNRGHWVGETRSDLTTFGVIRGFRHENGVSSEVSFPGSVLTRAYGINDAGVVVGQYQMEDGVSRPFLLRDEVYSEIKPVHPPGGLVSALATSINSQGMVLGTYRDLANVSKTWLMSPDGTFAYPALPGTGWGLNDAAQISGSFQDPDNANTRTAFVATPRAAASYVVHRIELTESSSAGASKINDRGQITGTVDGTDGVSRGFRFDTVAGREIERAGFGGSVFTEWGGINASGTLAGYYADPADPDLATYRAFVRDAGGAYQAIAWSGDPDFGFTVDIDEHGRVAGGGGKTAWVWNTNGTFQVFEVSGFTVNGAFGMNDHGLVVGAAWPGFFDTPNGLVYDLTNNRATIWNYPGAAQTTLYGINDRGDLVGEFKPDLTSANIPFVRWANGTPEVLHLPGLSGVRVYDINDDGVIVGRYKDAANKNRAFYATPVAPLPERFGFVFETVDIPGSSETLLSDIRNDGTLLGRFKINDGVSQGFVQSGTNLTTFNVTGTTATFPGGIDNFGRVAGFYRNATNAEIQHGFIRDLDGTITTIDGPGQTFTYAWRINDAGQVNGYWFEDPFFITSFRRAPNGVLTTNVFAGSPMGTVARGLNDAGDMAGWKWTADFTLEGVVFAGGATNVFAVPGWDNTLPADINNSGDIAGTVNINFERTAGFFRAADGRIVTFVPPGAVSAIEVFGLNDHREVVGEFRDASGLHGFVARPVPSLTYGHVDLGIGFENGDFDLHVHDEETDTEYAPDRAVIAVGSAAEQAVPDAVSFSFLGEPGRSTWILPTVSREDLVFLGLGAEEIPRGLLVGDRLRLDLVGVSGPGDFALFSNDAFGNPVVHLNTADGLSAADSVSLLAGAHAHFNWAFGAPGTYRIGLRAIGSLVEGNTLVSSDVAYYTFTVPAAQLPQPADPDPFVYNLDLIEVTGAGYIAGEELNESGAVAVGAYAAGEVPQAGLLTDALTVLSPMTPSGAYANGINDGNWVVGWSLDAGGLRRPVKWTNGIPVDLGTLGGDRGEARAVNNAGWIVGQARIATGESRAFAWTPSNGMRELPITLGGDRSAASAINEAGLVAGSGRLANGATHAVRHDPATGTTLDLGTLGGDDSFANGINAAGLVVGLSDATNDAFRPFLWSPDSGMRDLFAGGNLGAPSGAAYDINSTGQVVGYGEINASYDSHAFLWTEGMGVRDLNGLVARVPGLELWGAAGINDAGQISGWGTLHGTRIGFRLHPATRLPRGHTDVGLTFENGVLGWEVHGEDAGQAFEPHAALLNVPARAQTAVPDNAAYAFLGAPGAPVWILPQTGNPKLLFLGLATEEIPAGTFVGDQVTLSLLAVSGPGDFSVYAVSGFGLPDRMFDTRDGITADDRFTLGAGGHNHVNWAFTAPGYYRVTLVGQGTLVDGNQPVSTRADFFFEVIGASPSLGLIRSAENLSLTLNTEDGVQYRLQSSSALGSAWTDVGGAFIGTGRTKSITLPQDAPAAFFRVLVGN